MKRRLIPTLIIAIVMLGSSALRAQNLNPNRPTNRFGNPTGIARTYQGYVYGVIRRIDVKRHRLILDKTVYGNRQICELTRHTKYVRNDKRSTLRKLRVGDAVYVDAHRNKKTGVIVAKKIVTGFAPTGGV